MALFGFPSSPKAPAAGSNADGAMIFDATVKDFEIRVLQASMKTPVLVDFWAPWCGPCRQLGPELEAEVTAAKGAVLLAKVNIDENPELAQAFRVQSVPMVIALFQGQPVTGFVGAQPASEIKKLVAQLVQMAGAAAGAASGAAQIDVPAALKQAAEALGHGRPAEAEGLYATILQADPTNAPAYAGLVRTLIAVGDLHQAEGLMVNAPEEIKKSPDYAAARTALDLASLTPPGESLEPLQGRIAANPDDHAARVDLALALFADGHREAAIDELIESLRRNREWEDGRAKTQLLQFFEAMGPADPLTLSGRRKMSSVLFS